MQEVDFMWKADMFNLSRGVAKFVLNSVLNTLPTKDNLSRWGKTISQSCDMCGNRETMLHVLSGCPTALEQGRYTWRHDSILARISSFITTDSESDVEVFCDAGGRAWTIPPDILPTSDRPDLVILSRKNKSISIFELTVPYETNLSKSHQFKCHKYTHLVIDLMKCGYTCKFFAMELGCRGLVSEDNNNRLHAFYRSIPNFKFTAKDFRLLKKSLYKTVTTSSFIIYKARFQPTWCKTPLILNL